MIVDFFKHFRSVDDFNSQNETLFLILMIYVLCSIENLLNVLGILGRLLSSTLKLNFFVQDDDIPSVSDLPIVENLQQNGNFASSTLRIFSFFLLMIYLLCPFEKNLRKSSLLGNIVILAVEMHYCSWIR